MTEGIIQISFTAETEEALPILPFNVEIPLQVGEYKTKARVLKATIKDNANAGMHNTAQKHEVLYTLET